MSLLLVLGSLAGSLLAIAFMAEEQPAASSLKPATFLHLGSTFSAQQPASSLEPASALKPANLLHPDSSTLELANPLHPSTNESSSFMQPAASAPEPASPLHCTVEHLPSSLEPAQKYVLRYTGNHSKKWDGKEIILDRDYLQSLVEEESELVPGGNVKLPWTKRGGGKEVWNAVIVSEQQGQYVLCCLLV